MAHGIHLTLVCPGHITTNLLASGTYGGDLDAERARERIPFKFIDVPTAVRHTLDAVLARRQLAVFPGYVRGLWWMQRLSPRLLNWVKTLGMREQRKRHGTAL